MKIRFGSAGFETSEVKVEDGTNGDDETLKAISAICFCEKNEEKFWCQMDFSEVNEDDESEVRLVGVTWMKWRLCEMMMWRV